MQFQWCAILVHPPYSMCLPSAAHGTQCRSSHKANATTLQDALSWVCSKDHVYCSPINPGGKCAFNKINDLKDKCNWAFDQYYQAHVDQGERACSMSGAGELITPPCGEYNQGNEDTGRGFAFPDSSFCLKESSRNWSSCIFQNGTCTKCRRCVTKMPNTSTDEVLCQWVPSGQGLVAAPLWFV